MLQGTRARLTAAVIFLLILAIVVIGIQQYRQKNPRLPSPDSPRYVEMVSAFYTGLLAMQVGDPDHGPKNLLLATQIVPQEPAPYADMGLYELRLNNVTQAQQFLDKARDLAPDNGPIEALLGLLSRHNGQYPDAIRHFQRAIQLDPNDLRARYSLVEVLGQQAGPDTDAQTQQQLEAILKVQPRNSFVQIELGRLAARTGNADLLRHAVSQIMPLPSWTAEARQQLKTVQSDAAKGSTRQAATDLTILGHLLVETPQYLRDERAVQDDPTNVGVPVDHFLRLPPPSPLPAPPDTAMSFTPSPLGGGQGTAASRWAYARSAFLGPDTPAAVILADGRTVQVAPGGASGTSVAFPGGPQATPPTPDGILPVNWTNQPDFKVGLVLAGAGGVRLFRPQPGPGFSDVTAQSTLPAAVLNGAYTGVWAEDIDSDGDLDLILGAAHGPPTVLRNNGSPTENGPVTFTVLHPFPTDGLSAFAWVDLDGDGDPDAAIIDGQGRLRVFQNRRAGAFQEWPVPASLGKAAALSVADVTRTGRFSLVVLGTDGAISGLTRTDDGWKTDTLAQWASVPTDGSARLTWADLDNNGGLDLLATGSGGSQVWLSDQQGRLAPLAAAPAGRSLTVDAQDDHGRLDLLGLGADGQPVRLSNKGAKDYRWQQIRLRSKLTADRRNNAYGIGGFIELRSGLLYAQQPVTQPVTHFGLGTAARADAVRITWPNGVTQGEFELKPDQMAEAPERLKGSCPWLFAWDGHRMTFVTDFLWRSALGLRINNQNTAGVVMTGDWNKIRGDQLVARDGFYDLRLTTQLWETYYFDLIQLLTVDHPAGTDIWVDERFSVPPPRLAYRVMTPPHPLARAVDDRGRDVTAVLRDRDGKYLDTFGRGPYQGIARDHWVEVDLGKDVPAADKQWLLCNGWIHPTDSSINLAISQGRHPTPVGVRVEVPDGHGGWRFATPNIGFPEGKMKTMLIPLGGLFKPGMPHRLRLRTNLEVYWDWIAWATEVPQTPTRARKVALSSADLRYHGFNVINKANLSSPDIPDYDHVAQVTQRWLDMTGFYTRYGDVRPLLAGIDDRYIIMNAGDELAMRFPAPPPPPPGWTRDFVLIGDGWGKDCDHNSGFSKTVLPLPYHADRFYTRPPGRLEDEPAYRMHPRDWQTYQTRYVTPRPFQDAWRPQGQDPPPG